jgi:hypothetical protein
VQGTRESTRRRENGDDRPRRAAPFARIRHANANVTDRVGKIGGAVRGLGGLTDPFRDRTREYLDERVYGT